MVSLLAKRPNHTALRRGDAKMGARFRDLYTRVLMSTGITPGTTLGVSSAIDGEGKTTVALSLATQLASDGALGDGDQPGDILVIECNQGPSIISQEFAVAAEPGLIHYLQRECPVEQIIKPTALGRLWAMPVGGVAPTFSILIRRGAMPQMVHHLRERFSFIIVDLPSVLTTTDTQVLAELTDALVLVVHSGVTPAKLVRQALDELDADKLIGTVLNDWRPQLPAWLENRL